MKRSDILKEISKYFNITELVCDHTFKKFGTLSWQFLDTELLETLLVLRRDVFKRKMFINHDDLHQRGLRCNICPIVIDNTLKTRIYLSAHCNGAGVDFDVEGITAEEARKIIHKNELLLPYPIRLEANVAWVHLDVYDMNNGNKINEFNA